MTRTDSVRGSMRMFTASWAPWAGRFPDANPKSREALSTRPAPPSCLACCNLPSRDSAFSNAFPGKNTTVEVLVAGNSSPRQRNSDPRAPWTCTEELPCQYH